MSVKHTFNCSIASDASGTLSGSCSELGSTEVNIDKDFASGSTDVNLAVAFTVAGLQSIILVADADCTIETNSGTTPGDTKNLKAGRPLEWRKSDGYHANPFTVDVTGFYITSSTAVRIRGKILKS